MRGDEDLYDKENKRAFGMEYGVIAGFCSMEVRYLIRLQSLSMVFASVKSRCIFTMACARTLSLFLRRFETRSRSNNR